MDTPQGTPEGNADRAQGLGHRLRNSQAQTLPRRTRSQTNTNQCLQTALTQGAPNCSTFGATVVPPVPCATCFAHGRYQAV